MDNDTLFPTHGEAEFAADCCNRDDAEWTYTVVLVGKYWKIKVLDEDGELLGYL